MTKSITVDILPDRPFHQYSQSDIHNDTYVITGKFNVTLTRARKINKINLNLKGFFRFENKATSFGTSSPKLEVPFVDLDVVVMPNPTQFLEGVTEVYWRLPVPDNLPSSFGGYGADISYTLTASLILPGLLPKCVTATVPFDIWRSARFEQFPRGNTTVTHESQRNGRFKCEVKAPKYFAPGRGIPDRLEIQFKLLPQCEKLMVKQLLVKLFEVEDYHIPPRYESRASGDSKVTDISSTRICIGSTVVEGVSTTGHAHLISLEVPKASAKEDTFSTFVDVAHYVRVTLQFEDNEPDFDLEFPLIIVGEYKKVGDDSWNEQSTSPVARIIDPRSLAEFLDNPPPSYDATIHG